MSSTPTSPSVDTGAPDVAASDSPRHDEPDARLLRALADLDNLRKRYEARLAHEAEDERRRVVARWFPVVDDLERALQHVGDDPLTEGVRAVYEEALAVLASLGFEPFDDVGAPFDPARHEAVGTMDLDTEPGRIVAAVRSGYTHGDTIARPAQVIVSRTHPD
jgi:molecular chaperone GrpE